jgi:hypothetical protein
MQKPTNTNIPEEENIMFEKTTKQDNELGISF